MVYNVCVPLTLFQVDSLSTGTGEVLRGVSGLGYFIIDNGSFSVLTVVARVDVVW
jgi:hypothetical protein